MAKGANSGGEVSFVEKHIEKMLLGLCILLLLWAVMHWVPQSPRTVNVLTPAGSSRTNVPPDKANESLKQGVEKIWSRYDQFKAPHSHLVDWKKMLNELAVNTGANYPGFPDIGVTGTKIRAVASVEPGDLPTLEDVCKSLPVPPAPIGRLKAVLPRPQQPEAKIEDRLSTTLAVVYPWRDLMLKWHEELRRLPAVPTVIVGVEWQVREAPLDGEWGEPRPVTQTWLPLLDSQNKPIPPFAPTPGNAEEINQAIQIAAQVQAFRLIPQFDDIYVPGLDWVSPLHLVPENPLVTFGEPVTLTVEQTGMAPMQQPRPTNTPSPEIMMDDMGMPMGPDGMPAGMPGGNTRGRTPTRTPPRRPTPPPPAPVEKVRKLDFAYATIQSLDQQFESGFVLAVHHDNTIKTGVRYQYRARLVLINPLLGQAPYVQNAQEAGITTVSTQWSPWSQEQVQPSQTRFFLAGHSSAAQKMTLALYTHTLGQTVAHEGFTAQLGGLIGHKKKVNLPNPIKIEGVPEVSEVEADFATDNIVVRFDFDRKFIRPGSVNVETTAGLLYLDKHGQLHWRIQADDTNSQEYKDLKKAASGK